MQILIIDNFETPLKYNRISCQVNFLTRPTENLEYVCLNFPILSKINV